MKHGIDAKDIYLGGYSEGEWRDNYSNIYWALSHNVTRMFNLSRPLGNQLNIGMFAERGCINIRARPIGEVMQAGEVLSNPRAHALILLGIAKPLTF